MVLGSSSGAEDIPFKWMGSDRDRATPKTYCDRRPRQAAWEEKERRPTLIDIKHFSICSTIRGKPAEKESLSHGALRRPRLATQLCYRLAAQPWGNHLGSLCCNGNHGTTQFPGWGSKLVSKSEVLTAVGHPTPQGCMQTSGSELYAGHQTPQSSSREGDLPRGEPCSTEGEISCRSSCWRSVSPWTYCLY